MKRHSAHQNIIIEVRLRGLQRNIIQVVDSVVINLLATGVQQSMLKISHMASFWNFMATQSTIAYVVWWSSSGPKLLCGIFYNMPMQFFVVGSLTMALIHTESHSQAMLMGWYLRAESSGFDLFPCVVSYQISRCFYKWHCNFSTVISIKKSFLLRIQF